MKDTSLLINPGFNHPWGLEKSHFCWVIPLDGRPPYHTNVDNAFCPPGWQAWFVHEPGTWDQPEVKLHHKSNFPNRVIGERSVLLFTVNRCHDAGLQQTVRVEPGSRIRLSAQAHAWSNHDLKGHEDCKDKAGCSCGAGYGPVFILEGEAPFLSDPSGSDPWSDALQNFTFGVGIDPTGGNNPLSGDVIWGRGVHIYNEYHEVPEIEVDAGPDGVITVFLRSKARWPFKHNDAYWGTVDCTIVDSDDPDPDPDPEAAEATRLGPHVLRPCSGLSEYLRANPAVVKLVDEFGPGLDVPEGTLVIGRTTQIGYDAQLQYSTGKSPAEAAKQYVGDCLHIYQLNPHIRYWEGHNEPVWADEGGMAWYAQFEIERMYLMEGYGLRCIIGNFSSGYPPLDLWPAFLPACQAGKGFEAILGLHEYSCPWMWWMTGKHQINPNADEGDEGWTTLRYRKVYRQHLIPGNAALPLVITECGIDPMVRPLPEGCKGGAWKDLGDFWRDHDDEPDKAAFYARQLIWYDRELQKDKCVVGATVFTWGSYGRPWSDFDVAGTRVAEKLTDYALAHPARPFEYPSDNGDSDPDPDPDPDEDRGAPRVQYERTYVLLPPNAGVEWAVAAMDAVWPDRRWTVGGSADDAGIGDLDVRRVVAVNPDGWGGLRSFYQAHYPGVEYCPVHADSPEDLAVALLNAVGGRG